MIPRFKPYLDQRELWAIVRRQADAVTCFEASFAHCFEAAHALAFPYGRSALWALFKALGIEGAEIIMPAYTCVVVAHAIVLSDNIPRFVDINLYDYNMDLTQVEAAINERTRAVIATHLFGYPLNVDHLNEIVQAAEMKWGHKIWIIQDCAHSFGAHWRGKLVCNEGDAALFGLNVSKMITSIFGGMLTINDMQVNECLRHWRGQNLSQPGLFKVVQRYLYLVSIYLAFNDKFYGFVNWLQESTPILDHFTKAYHLDEKVHFPPDFTNFMMDIEAKVGLVQLNKYHEIIKQREEMALFYHENLPDVPDWVLPPIVPGATYSHYVIRVPNRNRTIKSFNRKGIQLGQLIEYSIPHMEYYSIYADENDFPNARLCSLNTINLPIHSSLHTGQHKKIVNLVRNLMHSKMG